jgi:hypothetical protein
MKLEIILRTCDRGNISKFPRFISVSNVMRINPISSLTLHMQSHLQEDPYINWREWWKHYTTIEKIKN